MFHRREQGRYILSRRSYETKKLRRCEGAALPQVQVRLGIVLAYSDHVATGLSTVGLDERRPGSRTGGCHTSVDPLPLALREGVPETATSSNLRMSANAWPMK